MEIHGITSLDRRLSVDIALDGSKMVVRHSPFNARKDFEILEVKNEFIGSGRWLRGKLISMDTQRHDIAGRVRRNNLGIRNRKNDNRIHRELAGFIANGGDSFIN